MCILPRADDREYDQRCLDLASAAAQLLPERIPGAAVEGYAMGENYFFDVAQTHAAVWNTYGMALYRVGKYSDAIRAFQQAIECDKEVKGVELMATLLANQLDFDPEGSLPKIVPDPINLLCITLCRKQLGATDREASRALRDFSQSDSSDYNSLYAEAKALIMEE